MNASHGSSDWWEKGGQHSLLHTINPTRMAYLRERCGDLGGKRVLDVGCGGGILSVALAEAGAQVTGIDIAAGALEAARAEASRRALPVEFEQADAADYRGGGDYDMVVCMEMLEHVANPAVVIATLSKLVRQGGDVVVATINRTFPARAVMLWGLEECLGVLPRGSHDYASFLRPDEVGEWCKEAGMRVLDIAGANWNFFGKTFLLSRKRMPVNYLLHARA